MSTRTLRTSCAVAALALVGLAGVALPAGTAWAGTPPTITVQDQGSHDGAGIDTDGTQGEFHPAVTGTVTGPLMDAAPQYKAG
ncbi:MAG: hypothetical protein E6Q56_05750 [Mycobacterium sp.]|nr:MAG: hypothetical protein E6Q56_05750 [Mycobacterium sp.]